MITDEDRKAAAEMVSGQFPDTPQYRLIARGGYDDHPAVQAFARNRIAAEQRGYQQGMEEAAATVALERLSDPQDEADAAYDRAIDHCEAAIRAKAKEKKHG